MKRVIFITLLIVSVLPAVKAHVTAHQLNENVSFQAVTWQDQYVLATGTSGGIYLSEDDGVNWQQVAPPIGGESLQFRDNQRLSNGRLVVMSAGEGADSSIFISDEEGESWQRTSQGEKDTTFYDCFYMTTLTQGWLYGDSDPNGLFVLVTIDGGQHWHRQNLPFTAQTSEGGFASSGTCLSGAMDNGVVIGTGNAKTPRLLLMLEGQWQSIVSPIEGGEASGIFSVQATGQTLFVSGGSLIRKELPAQAWQYHIDRQKWIALPELPLRGAVYGSALLDNADGVEYWVSNPQGVAVLKPGKGDWQMVSRSNIWSLACQTGKGCIGVGKNGAIEQYQ